MKDRYGHGRYVGNGNFWLPVSVQVPDSYADRVGARCVVELTGERRTIYASAFALVVVDGNVIGSVVGKRPCLACRHRPSRRLLFARLWHSFVKVMRSA